MTDLDSGAGLSGAGLGGAGFIAGFIDSIAGGGGLITLPVLSDVVGAGVHAVGTNKIVGFTGAFVAFLVYWRRQRLLFFKALPFLLAIGMGSAIGSRVTPYLSQNFFRIMLIAVSPLILGLIWRKSLWQREADYDAVTRGRLVSAGMVSGFYDGFFGPGGGTFMLIALLWVARFALFDALLLSKLANSISAGVALISFARAGYVHFSAGLPVAVGMLIGGFVGSSFASRRAERIVRPIMTLVVLGLMGKVAFDLMR